MIDQRQVRIVALDLPISWMLAKPSDEFTGRVFRANQRDDARRAGGCGA
ncbi:hypothetical protein [Lichenifustis flavocetrariae]